MGIIPTFEEHKDGLSAFRDGVQGHLIQEFTFERGKETLTQGVVKAIAYRAHRRENPRFPTAGTESQGGVLTALIGVVNDAFWVALANGHLQGIKDQVGA